MENNKKRQILLTNDDGIRSPGLWAAAAALSTLGYVHVAAPREQYSGAGRSLPSNSDGIIHMQEVVVNDQCWPVYSVGGSPAQAVLHAVLEIMPQRPELVVSGINYGENVGSGVTVSGTVGAAMEAASNGISALAVSLETDLAHHMSYSTDVDFSAAAHFTASATAETPWQVTRLSMRRYFEAVPVPRRSWDEPGSVGYRVGDDWRDDDPDTDVYALRLSRTVSLTPLSLDLTSRVNLAELEAQLRQPG